MKRLATILALMFFTLYGFAQAPSLRGTWENETKAVMGTSCKKNYVFEGDSEGKVLAETEAVIDAKFFGVTFKGGFSFIITGLFSYEGETLEMNWDKDSLHHSIYPITLDYKGKEMLEDMRDDIEKDLKELDKEMEETLAIEMQKISEEELNKRYQCTVKNDKLVLATKDENGKTVKEKFTLVQ